MKPLVSVIIPNYNAERYIKRCIESVVNQTYSRMEIIIIDDGSTDSSLNIINGIISNFDNVNVYCQENMNSAIARNRGIEIANGEYMLFLDSDDILYENTISKMVHCAENEKSDLVIGNYKEIDQDDNILQECNVIAKYKKLINPMEFVGMVPNPTNKLYSKRIIDLNNIVWGNVRIGQDLNFFLKYLMCCKTISIVSEYIYGWRVLQGSISNSYNFRIFDIVESFKDTKRFYVKYGNRELYDEYVSAIEYRHYYLQMEKQKNFRSNRARRIVIDYFSFMLQQINLMKSKNLSKYSTDIKKCRLKLLLKMLYASNFYKRIDSKFARKCK